MGLPFSSFKSLLRKKDIRLNDKKVQDDQVLALKDALIVFLQTQESLFNKEDNSGARKQEQHIPHSKIKLMKESILFQDENVICINKPYDVSVQGGTGISYTALDILEKIINQKLYIVHRIDRETRGVLVIAKNLKTAQDLSLAFSTRAVQKEYLAIVSPIPKVKSGVINNHIIVDDVEKSAITRYETLLEFQDKNIAILKVTPETGRKHQIRIHLQNIGSPIIGDRKHGGNKMRSRKLQLFATKLEIAELKVEIDVANILNLSILDI